MTSREGWPEWYLAQFAGYTSGWARGVRSYLSSLTMAYSHSGNKLLHQRARELMESIIDLDAEHGVVGTIDNHKLGGEPYYVINPLLTYHQQTGDDRAIEAARRGSASHSA